MSASPWPSLHLACLPLPSPAPPLPPSAPPSCHGGCRVATPGATRSSTLPVRLRLLSPACPPGLPLCRMPLTFRLFVSCRQDVAVVGVWGGGTGRGGGGNGSAAALVPTEVSVPIAVAQPWPPCARSSGLASFGGGEGWGDDGRGHVCGVGQREVEHMLGGGEG
ncbi:hypothetical protein I4F81_010116 [Pyropia yezoensis]|uniref:Uncharacterized protein n=1 Tax=Pyropia yezoensis TaxID=2788 RepID=A0ACC3CBY0_PYRYE|nr:hypothetical protein I4F81_010116 [Neopyropia yezoensis]